MVKIEWTLCKCAERTDVGTYPLTRDNPHLPDCLWWWIDKLQNEINELRNKIK